MARGSRSSGRRTDYSWGNFGDFESSHNLTTSTAVFGSTKFDFSTPGTIARVRGRVGVNLDAAAVDERTMVVCGLMVGATDSIVTGVAPEVFTNGADEARWLWQGSLYLDSGAEAAVNNNGLIRDLEIDSKGMARVKPNESIGFVFQTPADLTVDQGGVIDLIYFVHVLVGS